MSFPSCFKPWIIFFFFSFFFFWHTVYCEHKRDYGFFSFFLHSYAKALICRVTYHYFYVYWWLQWNPWPPKPHSCNISAHTLYITYAYTHLHTNMHTDIALTTWQKETQTVGRPQTEQTVSDVRWCSGCTPVSLRPANV